jgi:hypothetical protein
MLPTEDTDVARPLPAVVTVADEMRQALRLTHQQFVDALGRPKSEWHSMRATRRGASVSFTAALRSYARTVGGIWPSRIDVAVQQDALARVVAAESADAVPA